MSTIVLDSRNANHPEDQLPSRNHSINQRLSIYSTLGLIVVIINIFLVFLGHETNLAQCNPDIHPRMPQVKEDTLKNQMRMTTENSNEDYNEKFNLFVSNVTSFVYSGKWTSENMIRNFESNFGIMNYHLGLRRSILSNVTWVENSIKLYEEGYADNWYFLQSHKNVSNATVMKLIDFEKKTFLAENCTTSISQGKIFEKVGTVIECPSVLSFHWEEGTDTEGETYVKRMKGNLTTQRMSCDLYIDLSFSLERVNPEAYITPFLLYSLVISLLVMCVIGSTMLLNNHISESFSKSNSLSLFTVGQNIIWNAYGCLCHFFLAVNNDSNMACFAVPSVLFFINFSVCDLRLLYNLWRNHYANENQNLNAVRRKLIQFYVTFYVFLFISLFFITKFYFEKPYIMAAVVVTWLPQIIHNVIFKNFLSMPILAIVANTLNKVMIPFYFRGCPKNIFMLKPDYNFIIICTAIISCEILVMYLQTIIGPRFFIPCKIESNEHRFYYTKEELIEMNKDIEITECAICIYPLFSSEALLKSTAEEEFPGIFEALSENNRFSFWKKLWEVLMDFHEYSFISKKPYMLTPCNHAFHTPCLESWMKLKRECPTDRIILPNIQK